MFQSDIQANKANWNVMGDAYGLLTDEKGTRDGKYSASFGEIVFSAASIFMEYKALKSTYKTIQAVVFKGSAYSFITHAFFAVLAHDLFKVSYNLAYYSKQLGDAKVGGIFKAFIEECVRSPKSEPEPKSEPKPKSFSQVTRETLIKGADNMKDAMHRAKKVALLTLIQETLFQGTIAEPAWKKGASYLVNGLEVAVPFCARLMKNAEAYVKHNLQNLMVRASARH